MASQEGHHDVVQSLLGAGAEVNIARSDVSDVTCVHRVHYMYIVVRTEGKHNMGCGCVCVLECVCFMCDVCSVCVQILVIECEDVLKVGT